MYTPLMYDSLFRGLDSCPNLLKETAFSIFSRCGRIQSYDDCFKLSCRETKRFPCLSAVKIFNGLVRFDDSSFYKTTQQRYVILSQVSFLGDTSDWVLYYQPFIK